MGFETSKISISRKIYVVYAENINDMHILPTVIIEKPLTAGVLLGAAALSYHKITFTFCMVIFLGLLYFYRQPYPDKRKFRNSSSVYSPAYGTVTHIIKNPNKCETYITIFLSPFDIHHQYYPISGTLVERTYDRNGRFNLAYEFAKASTNEKCIHKIKTEAGHIVQVIQIAGFLVRRIVYDDKMIGDKVTSADRLGMIQFGSRVDIIVPTTNVVVTEGQSVSMYSKICDL